MISILLNFAPNTTLPTQLRGVLNNYRWKVPREMYQQEYCNQFNPIIGSKKLLKLPRQEASMLTGDNGLY